MKRCFSFLFHSLLFLLLLVGIDQAFVHLPMELPGLRQSQTFYRDVRSRLPALGWPGLPELRWSENRGAEGAEERPADGPLPAGPSYVYPDADGQLRFAEGLEDIPAHLRARARALER